MLRDSSVPRPTPLSRIRRAPERAAVALLVLALAVVALFAWLSWRSEREAARAHFDAGAQEMLSSIEDRIDAYVDVLLGAAALFAASEHVSSDEFGRYVRALQLDRRYPGIQGVGFSVRAPVARADSLRASVAGDIVRTEPWTSSAADSGYIHRILYLEPLDRRNRAAIGFDMFSESTRRDAMVRARDTGNPAASGIVRLVQEIDEDVQSGFLIYVPVYENHPTPEEFEARRSDLVGYVYAPFRVRDLMTGIVPDRAVLDLEIYDGPRADSARLLYAARRAGDRSAHDEFRSSRMLDVHGRSWTLIVSGSHHLYDPVGSGLVRSATVAGVLLSLLLFAAALSVLRARRRAQDALLELARSGEQYRMLFNGNPHPMWVYDENTLRFLAVNDAAVAHYGYSRTEFLNLSLYDIRPVEDRSLLADVLSGRVREPDFWRHCTKDGELILVQIAAGAVTFGDRPARLVLAQDVTERQRAETELTQAKDRLQQTLSLSNAVIYTMDVRGEDLITTWVTQNLGRVTGYSIEEGMAPGWWYTHLHPDDRERVTASGPTLLELGHRSIEYRLQAKDGTYIWIRDDAVVRRDAAGAPKEIIGAWLDVTDRHRLEQQFQQAQKMEAIGRLAGGIAHDFNNILTVIEAQADMLVADLADDPHAAEVELIRTASQRGARLTSQLLAFSREQMLRPSVIDVCETIRSTMTMAARLISERVTIADDLPEDLPPIEVDQAQFEQALMNLVVNARDAMPDGGLLGLSARLEHLDAQAAEALELTRTGDYVVVSVSDTGSGMDESVRARIFDPFFTTKPRGKGTGLGLAMVYGFVKQSDGAVAVDTHLERGATFRLYFPASAKPSEVTSAPAVIVEQAREKLSGRVLLVEDEPSVASITRRILTRAGLEVEVVGSAEKALQRLDEAAFDVVLTDVGLPGMSGRQLVATSREKDSSIAFVVMSGYAEGVSDEPGELPRDIDFIQKPFAPETLMGALRAALERAARRS